MAQATTPLSGIKAYCSKCNTFTAHHFNDNKVQYECSICNPPVKPTNDIEIEIIEDITPTPYKANTI